MKTFDIVQAEKQSGSFPCIRVSTPHTARYGTFWAMGPKRAREVAANLIKAADYAEAVKKPRATPKTGGTE